MGKVVAPRYEITMFDVRCSMLEGTTPVPSLKEGGELYGGGCTARRNIRHGLLSLSAGPMGTAPLLKKGYD